MDLTPLKAVLNPKEAEYLEQALLTPIKSIESDIDIDLTLDEITRALLDAKIKKRALLKYEENNRMRQEKAKEIMQPFNTETLINFCHRFFWERKQHAFLVDKTNTMIVTELAKYFCNDESFNKGEYSLNKGIMIQGNVGTGKTTLMAFFQKNKKRCYTIKSCNTISEEYLMYKDEVDKIYSTPLEKPLADHSVFFQREIGYCFDDLGTEENKNAFGNKKNVMAEVILAIYDKKNSFAPQGKWDSFFNRFHVTTNLDDDDILNRYGSRVASRINEMFNVFVLDGEDRRK